MSCKTIPGINIAGADGYVYDFKMDVNYSSPTIVQVTFVKDGEFVPPILFNRTSLNIGSFSMKIYPVSYTLSKNSNSNFMTVKYYDDSLDALDNTIICPSTDRHYTGSSIKEGNTTYLFLIPATERNSIFTVEGDAGFVSVNPFPFGGGTVNNLINSSLDINRGANEKIANTRYSVSRLANACPMDEALAALFRANRGSSGVSKTIFINNKGKKITTNVSYLSYNSPKENIPTSCEITVSFNGCWLDLAGSLREVITQAAAQLGAIVYWNFVTSRLEIFDPNSSNINSIISSLKNQYGKYISAIEEGVSIEQNHNIVNVSVEEKTSDVEDQETEEEEEEEEEEQGRTLTRESILTVALNRSSEQALFKIEAYGKEGAYVANQGGFEKYFAYNTAKKLGLIQLPNPSEITNSNFIEKQIKQLKKISKIHHKRDYKKYDTIYKEAVGGIITEENENNNTVSGSEIYNLLFGVKQDPNGNGLYRKYKDAKRGFTVFGLSKGFEFDNADLLKIVNEHAAYARNYKTLLVSGLYSKRVALEYGVSLQWIFANTPAASSPLAGAANDAGVEGTFYSIANGFAGNAGAYEDNGNCNNLGLFVESMGSPSPSAAIFDDLMLDTIDISNTDNWLGNYIYNVLGLNLYIVNKISNYVDVSLGGLVERHFRRPISSTSRSFKKIETIQSRSATISTDISTKVSSNSIGAKSTKSQLVFENLKNSRISGNEVVTGVDTKDLNVCDLGNKISDSTNEAVSGQLTGSLESQKAFDKQLAELKCSINVEQTKDTPGFFSFSAEAKFATITIEDFVQIQSDWVRSGLTGYSLSISENGVTTTISLSNEKLIEQYNNSIERASKMQSLAGGTSITPVTSSIPSSRRLAIRGL